MRLNYMIGLILVLAAFYVLGPSTPRSRPVPVNPTAVAKPTEATRPIELKAGPKSVQKDVIFKQAQAPAKAPSPTAERDAEIERENASRLKPFRASTAGGPIQMNAKLPGKVDAVVGQRVPENARPIPVPPPPPKPKTAK